MRLALTALIGISAAYAQSGSPVRVSDDPSVQPVQKVYVISGTNIAAICISPSALGARVRNVVAISAVSKANPAVVTSVGHGFNTSSRPTLTISGATGTGWTAINATFVATIIDADTFSIPIDSSGFGTLAGTVVFTTLAPRTVVYEWAVQKFGYDVNNNVVFSGWINGSSGYQARCSDASSTTVSQQ